VELRWQELKGWASLSPEEQAFVRDAYEQGERRWAFLRNSPLLIEKLEALQAALWRLTAADKQWLLTDDELDKAYRGLPTARTHLASVEYQVEELLSWVEAPGRGKPRNLARLYCIGALRQLWIKAGGNPAPGKREKHNAFIHFLGDCLHHVDDHLKDPALARERAHYTLLEYIKAKRRRFR
jgi:hypothetical protein